MTRIVLATAYYIFALTAIIIAQRVFQTPDLTGPGYNIYVFFIAIVLSLYLLIRNMRTSVLREESFVPVFIHIAGIIIMVYLIFFDQVLMIRH